MDGVPRREQLRKLTVEDTGTGIPQELQSKVFDPFFTTKEPGKGTGLGLYIVHSVVTNHGGYINLYSDPGRGTRFNIYLLLS
jgi:two-component system cell cycle sensor histidine kinase/response regulator CckA